MNNLRSKKTTKLMTVLSVMLTCCMLMSNVAYAETMSNSNSSSDEVYATFNQIGSEIWGDKNVNKYEMTIHNNSDNSICNWKVTINEKSTVVWESGWGWCADYTADGSKLIITPQSSGEKMGDSIAAHTTYSSAGFYLIASNSDLSDVQISYEYGNYSTNSGSTTGSGGTTPVDTSGVNITGATKNLDASQTPVGIHGKLSVSGIHLTDSKGENYQLRGVSTHGINWFPEYVNKTSFQNLRDEWGVNAVRLAMYTTEYNGYCSGGDQNALKNLVTQGVDYATQLGMYVIVDWHILNDRTPLTYMDTAKVFFDEMSKKFADHNNVLYEICNEPNGGTSWEDIKTYAETIIPIIRNNDKDAIIIVGTPNWSQDVDVAAQNRIMGYDNIMYTLHFYSNTHQESYRNKMVTALEAGLPVMCTEYGVCNSSGDGGLNLEQANIWLDLMDKYEMSYFCWSLTNKGETASLLNSSSSRTSGYQTSDLSDAGKWLVSEYNKRNGESSQSGNGEEGGNTGSGDAGSGSTEGGSSGSGSTGTEGGSTESGSTEGGSSGSGSTEGGNTGSGTGTGNGSTGSESGSGNSGSGSDSGSTDPGSYKDGWNVINGVEYWYEGGVRQGLEGRGKEIFDKDSDAWYWLDSVQGGAKAVSKDVYQESLAGICGDSDGTDENGNAVKVGKWVRYDSQGHMIKGWCSGKDADAKTISSPAEGNGADVYYFDLIYGTMVKGYYTIDGVEYYFDENTGVLKNATGVAGLDGYTGWKTLNGGEYWFENGFRQGYSKDSSYRGKEIYDPGTNAWYWLDNIDAGKKAVSKDVYQESLAGDWGDKLDSNGNKIGKWVRYDANGHMIKGWQHVGEDTYYFDITYGTMAKGAAVIDGITYTFDSSNGKMQ